MSWTHIPRDKDARLWSDVFSRSRFGGSVFFVRDTHATHTCAGGYRGSHEWLEATIAAARDIDCVEAQGGTSSMASSATSSARLYGFLDGGIATLAGNYFGGPRGAWVCGKGTLGYLCSELGLKAPRRSVYQSYETAIGSVQHRRHWPNALELLLDCFHGNSDLLWEFSNAIERTREQAGVGISRVPENGKSVVVASGGCDGVYRAAALFDHARVDHAPSLPGDAPADVVQLPAAGSMALQAMKWRARVRRGGGPGRRS